MSFGSLVHFGRPVINSLNSLQKSSSGEPEQGGILLGAIRGPHLEVTGHTLPGPTDVRSRHQFIRQDITHQQIADEAWQRSGETITFIGEWHTHPSGNGAPSSVDLFSWKRICRSAGHRMCFVILSPAGRRTFVVLPKVLSGSCIELHDLEDRDLGITAGALRIG